jgi:hypothetical protein
MHWVRCEDAVCIPETSNDPAGPLDDLRDTRHRTPPTRAGIRPSRIGARPSRLERVAARGNLRCLCAQPVLRRHPDPVVGDAFEMDEVPSRPISPDSLERRMALLTSPGSSLAGWIAVAAMRLR